VSRAVALTIDLDRLSFYRRIHGASLPVGPSQPCEMLPTAVDAFMSLCDRLRVRGTLFVVAADVGDNPDLVAALRRAHAAGHEIANHSHDHDYRMSTWPVARIIDDIAAAQQQLASTTGVAPRGFRAPGYNMSASMWQALQQLGFAWDSSQLSSLAYFGARAFAIAAAAAKQRPSASLVGDWRAFTTPFQPALPELPISVALQVPLLGTAMILLPPALMSQVVDRTRHQPVVCIELHAVDVVATAHLDEARLQPDLRASVSDKLSRIERCCRAALRHGPGTTLSEALVVQR
jgi:peptidoglycan-N-acetylglucosamine deacetylase